MTDQELDERNRIVARARTYLRTPYHPEGRIRGVGVDCLTLLACVYQDEGLVIEPEIPHYSTEFMLHQSEEQYIEGLMEYTREITLEEAGPGDIAIWKFGRCFSHAAIIEAWPMIIHACANGNVRGDDVSKAEWLLKLGSNPRPVRFFSYWGRE